VDERENYADNDLPPPRPRLEEDVLAAGALGAVIVGALLAFL